MPRASRLPRGGPRRVARGQGQGQGAGRPSPGVGRWGRRGRDSHGCGALGRPRTCDGPGGRAAPEKAHRRAGAGAEARRPPPAASPVPRAWRPGDPQEAPGLGGRRRPRGPGIPADPMERGAAMGAPARW